MRDALKSYLALASGVTDLTRQKAVAAAKALVSQGEATAEQVTGLAEDLLAQTRHNREAVAALVGFEVDRALGRVGLATADEVGQLTARIRDLEQQLRAAASHAPTPPAAKAPGKPPAKKAAKPAAAQKAAPATTTSAQPAPAVPASTVTPTPAAGPPNP